MLSRSGVLIAIWVALAVASLALSILAAANDSLPGDKAVTEWLQDQPLPGKDLSNVVRPITTTEVVLAAGLALSLILWWRGYRRPATLLGVSLALLAVLQFGVKEIVDRPRPDAELVDVRAGRFSPSFPAGHVMSGTILYGFLIYLALTLPLARPIVGALVISAALVIVLSGPVNVWLGAHWPSDVLGGYLFAVVVLLPLIVWDRAQRQSSPNFS
jgi:membrane-associated phospholipid phosphatase